MFQRNQMWVYRKWEAPNPCERDAHLPDKNATHISWRNIWSVPVTHIDDDWMPNVRYSCEKPLSLIKMM